MTNFHMTVEPPADCTRSDATMFGSVGRIWAVAAIIALFGTGPALTQGLPMSGTATRGASRPAALGSLGAGAGGPALGTIQLNLGGLGQMQPGGMGPLAAWH